MKFLKSLFPVAKKRREQEHEFQQLAFLQERNESQSGKNIQFQGCQCQCQLLEPNGFTQTAGPCAGDADPR